MDSVSKEKLNDLESKLLSLEAFVETKIRSIVKMTEDRTNTL